MGDRVTNRRLAEIMQAISIAEDVGARPDTSVKAMAPTPTIGELKSMINEITNARKMRHVSDEITGLLASDPANR